ncbi:HlyD family efflux transporter periplasmic adaptor subunit [Acaryochloris marina]|uniref:HlyD family secretion protein n=1 Tax=Acaryochloris marina (strain MBIC 11017) TaxID=329726 RepID=A8ZKT1_ACAM1|nr:HlyD family efflux transporter periplasmic adaptor subunit [Acaryochloris marina]ABW31399.1 HlyD family secretion protein [Acaryochloris marina MBIC11017]
MTSIQTFAGGDPKQLNSTLTPESDQNVLPLTKAHPKKEKPFDRPVILQQSPVWSRAIIWGIVGAASAALAWACLFQIEEAIPATGQLEPKGAVKEIQSPVAGVVKEIKVEEGQLVKKGEVLLVLNRQGTRSEIQSLEHQRRNLVQVNDYYRQQLQGQSNAPLPDVIDSALINSTRDRQSLVAENKLYRAQLNGAQEWRHFSAEERQRLQSGLTQGSSSVAAAQARINQADKQLRQIEVQLEQTKIQLASAQQTLALNQEIVQDIEEAYRKGAIARVQFKQQQNEVQTGTAEVSRLQQEQIRLLRQLEQVGQEKQQAQAQALNTVATNQRELLDRIAANKKRISEIDSQLTKAIVDNQRTIADLENRLQQAKLTLDYQELKAPVDGMVFDLKPSTPGFVANASEPVLKIVPADNLKAKVYITNKDIGFIQTGMAADVRIDSFNFSEFGDIKGTVESIGSDALPPTEVRQFYSFPAVVKLDSQTLKTKERQLALQSGMSVNVNIKVRKRPVISLITDRFSREADGIKHLR